MNGLNRRRVLGALALLAGSAGAEPPYPAKPIRLVVPTVAGGPSDAAARVLAKGMGAGLGQEVVVENRPGANGGLAAAAVLTAAPDGYTLFFALVANAGLPHLSRTSPYKTLAEFSPVAAIGGNTLCLVVPSSLQVKTLAAFAAQAKASPKPLLRGANTPAENLVAGLMPMSQAQEPAPASPAASSASPDKLAAEVVTHQEGLRREPAMKFRVETLSSGVAKTLEFYSLRGLPSVEPSPDWTPALVLKGEGFFASDELQMIEAERTELTPGQPRAILATLDGGKPRQMLGFALCPPGAVKVPQCATVGRIGLYEMDGQGYSAANLAALLDGNSEGLRFFGAARYRAHVEAMRARELAARREREERYAREAPQRAAAAAQSAREAAERRQRFEDAMAALKKGSVLLCDSGSRMLMAGQTLNSIGYLCAVPSWGQQSFQLEDLLKRGFAIETQTLLPGVSFTGQAGHTVSLIMRRTSIN